MAKKTKTFEAFGLQYRTTQFSAIEGLAIMKEGSSVRPDVFLKDTYVVFPDGEFRLNTPANVDKYVMDVIANLTPRIVLTGIMGIVSEFNFGFLANWNPVSVPSRFTSGVEAVTSDFVDPLVSSIIQSNTASLRDLEEYYSLEDAFAMMDIMTAKGVNEAMAHEAAQEEAKRK